jgi:predicted O-methyltransferase YrrM
VNSQVSIAIVSIAAGLIVLAWDLQRRKLRLTKLNGWHFLSALDMLCPAVTMGAVGGLLAVLLPAAISQRALPLDSWRIWSAVAGIVIARLLWSEGRRQMQFQRPRGIVFGEWLILMGGLQFLGSMIGGLGVSSQALRLFSLSAILSGGIVIAAIVIPFVKKYEGHRILERFDEDGESVQAEYTSPTPECPHPELWRMLDSQTTEVEVIDLLKSLVRAVKPNLIVETGTFLGYSTITMAEGLRENGFGKVITIEYDPAIFAKAKERIDASGLANWIEYRNESSLETRIEGTIDILFSDSHLMIRENEIRRLLPQLDPRGLLLIHDASSHFQVVREAAMRLEQEGLISIVLLPTPRGWSSRRSWRATGSRPYLITIRPLPVLLKAPQHGRSLYRKRCSFSLK